MGSGSKRGAGFEREGSLGGTTFGGATPATAAAKVDYGTPRDPRCSATRAEVPGRKVALYHRPESRAA